MADDKTLPAPPPFQPVMRVTYETVGAAAIAFEGDKNNVWLIAGPRAPTIREKALPNFDPFEEAEPVFLDAAVTEVQFRYLNPDGGWTDAWDGQAERGLPQAVQIRLTATLGGRTETLPPLTISIPAR